MEIKFTSVVEIGTFLEKRFYSNEHSFNGKFLIATDQNKNIYLLSINEHNTLIDYSFTENSMIICSGCDNKPSYMRIKKAFKDFRNEK